MSVGLARRAVLVTGLPPSCRAAALPNTPRAVVVTPSELDELRGWAARERLTGLLWEALQRGELFLAGTDGFDQDTNTGAGLGGSAPTHAGAAGEATSAVDSVREAQLSALRYAVGAEAVALRAIELLRAAGIEPVVFKGLANAHLDEENPAHRGFFDADMLVRREHLHSAVDLLERADFDRTSEQLPRWWERRYTRAIELRHDAGTELDLHATLAAGYFGAILDLEAMFEATEVVDIGGVECTAFDPTGRFLVSAFAIVLSRGPRLRLVRDFVRQLVVTSADWRQAARRAGEGEIVIARAVLAVADEIGLEHEAVDWATSVSPSRSGRRALELASRAEQIGWSADARSALMACRGLEKATFVAGVAWPARRIQRLSTKQRGLVRA